MGKKSGKDEWAKRSGDFEACDDNILTKYRLIWMKYMKYSDR